MKVGFDSEFPSCSPFRRGAQLAVAAMFAISVLALAGCSRGLDRSFDTSSQDAFGNSIETMLSEASAEEAQVFRANMGDLLAGMLTHKLSGGGLDISKLTGRQAIDKLIRAAIEVQDENLAAANSLLKELSAMNSSGTGPDAIELTNPTFSPVSTTRDFFSMGSGPEVKFDLNNKSAIPLRGVTIQASIFLEDQTEPVASSRSFKIFAGGLDPGKQVTVRVQPGGAFGRNGGWDELSIRKAKKTRVVVALLEIEDYDKRKFVPSLIVQKEVDLLNATKVDLINQLAAISKRCQFLPFDT